MPALHSICAVNVGDCGLLENLMEICEISIPVFNSRRLHENSSHHAAIFVLDEMAVVNERADDARISEIHSQLHAGKRGAAATPKGYVHHVPQERLIHSYAVHFLQ